MKNYKKLNDKHYAVLRRKSESMPLESCVFCGESHKHGIGDGHRIAHCVNKPIVLVIDADAEGNDIIVSSGDGYYVETTNRR